MKITIGDTEYIHISEFAELINRSIPDIRYLIERGGIRRLKYIREGSRIYIEFSELTEYPFVKGGRDQSEIYHYRMVNGRYIRELCQPCTFREDIESCPEARRLYQCEERV